MTAQHVADAVAAGQRLVDLHRGTAGVGEHTVHALALQALHQDISALAGLVAEAVNPVLGAWGKPGGGGGTPVRLPTRLFPSPWVSCTPNGFIALVPNATKDSLGLLCSLGGPWGGWSRAAGSVQWAEGLQWVLHADATQHRGLRTYCPLPEKQRPPPLHGGPTHEGPRVLDVSITSRRLEIAVLTDNSCA